MPRRGIGPSRGVPRKPERHRWLRSDGKPNFEDRIYKTTEEMEILAKRPVETISPQSPILEAVEKMSRGYRSLVVEQSGYLRGLLLLSHIINYLGGGDYYNIVRERYNYNIYQALNKEKVETLMIKDPIVAYINEKIPDVLEKMVLNEIGIIPVVFRDGRVYGIVTEHDLLKYFISGVKIGVMTSEVMSSPVVTIESGSPLIDAMKKMIKYGFRRIPVVGGNVVLGIITAMDVVKYFGTHEAFKRTSSGNIEEALSIPVDDLMVRELVTARPDEDLGDVAQRMAERDVGSALVVNDKMELIGIITERDILYAVTAKH